MSPVYYVVIDGITTKHYSTGPVLSPAVTKKPYLSFPLSIGQKVQQQIGRTSLNLFPLRFANALAEMNDLFATEKSSPTIPSLINRRVTLRSGYADLAEADFAIYAVGQIRSAKIEDDGTLWTFDLADLRRGELETVFLNADLKGQQNQLAFASNFVAGVGRLVATGDPTSWAQGDRIYLGPSTDSANPGAEEKVTVQQVRDVTNEIFVDPVTTYKYKAGDPIRGASSFIRGNPLNMALAILTGDFANGSWPLDLVLGQPTGLNILAADIDTAGIIKERDRVYPSAVWELEISRPASGARMLEALLYRWNGYPRVLLDGRLSFRCFRPPFVDDVTAGLPTIVEADVLAWTASRDIDSHLNRVALGVDTSVGGGSAQQTVTVEDTADQATTDEESELREENTGLVGGLAGVRLAQGRASVMLRRFMDGPYQVKVKVHAKKRAIQVGEDVLFTHSRVPNPASVTPGLTAKRLEVVERTEDLVNGQVELVLQDANFTRPFFIGPTGGLPDYDAASASEREYGYIGPSGGGNFSDGTPGYEIV